MNHFHLYSVPTGPATDYDPTRPDADKQRQVLEQARGILMEQFGLDALAADDLVRSWSSELGLASYTLALMVATRATTSRWPLEPPANVLAAVVKSRLDADPSP